MADEGGIKSMGTDRTRDNGGEDSGIEGMVEIEVVVDVEPGVYQHYKGRFYLVIGEVVDHETRQPMVLYVPLYLADRTQKMTVRMLESFCQKFRRIDP